MRKKSLAVFVVLIVMLSAAVLAACNDTDAVNVTVSIADKSVTEIYAGGTLQLTADKDPASTEVTWASSDSSVAAVSADGLVTGIKAGAATISVKVGDEVKDSIAITVKDSVIDPEVNADKLDLSGIYSDNATVKGSANTFAAFKGDKGMYYVASAIVNVTAPSGDDTWSRVGISHWNGESYYGLMLSPGPDFNARKTVTMVIDTEGNVGWGTVTDRSQVWNQHDLGAIDFSAVKLTTVRRGNEFYAFINDALYYYEAGIDGFTDAGTVPVLNMGSCTAEFSALSVSYGREAAEEYLADADDSDFYASSDKVILGADGSIKFTGASDGTSALNTKDHAAKHIGAKAVLPAGVESSISFDLTVDAFGTRDALPALIVTMNRYDQTYAEARSLLVGEYKAGWTGWNSNGDLPSGIGGPNDYSLGEKTARLEQGATYKVVVTRLMTETGQDNKLTVKDADGNVLFEGTWGWNNDGYTGRASVSFMSRDMDCTISNIVIA